MCCYELCCCLAVSQWKIAPPETTALRNPCKSCTRETAAKKHPQSQRKTVSECLQHNLHVLSDTEGTDCCLSYTFNWTMLRNYESSHFLIVRWRNRTLFYAIGQMHSGINTNNNWEADIVLNNYWKRKQNKKNLCASLEVTDPVSFLSAPVWSVCNLTFLLWTGGQFVAGKQPEVTHCVVMLSCLNGQRVFELTSWCLKNADSSELSVKRCPQFQVTTRQV